MASPRPHRPTRWDRPKAADDADPVFRFFPQFPPEIRCIIWELCLPHRVVEIKLPVRNSWAGVKCGIATSVTNNYLPLISRVCREAREVALRRGVDIEWQDAHSNSDSDPESDPDSDSEPEPAEDSDPDIDPGALPPPGRVRIDPAASSASGRVRPVNRRPCLRPKLSYPHYNQPWIQPRRDILHLPELPWTLDANRVDGIWHVSGIADIQLLHYIQTRVQAPAISIQADLVLSFCRRWANRRNHDHRHSNLLKILARRDEYMVVVETVVLHVDPDANLASLSGLFGVAADNPIQLVDPDDSAAMDQWRKLWWLHGSALDNDAERFFARMMPKHGMGPDTSEIRTRVAQWRRDVVKAWIWYRWRRHRLRDRQNRPELRTDSVWLGEDSWDEVNWNATRPMPGPLFQNYTRPWAIDMVTREPNYGNPWVQRTWQKMPRFHPMIMFRICGMDCDRKRRPYS